MPEEYVVPEGFLDMRGLSKEEQDSIQIIVVGLLEKKMLLKQRESEGHSDR